ncbi:MAG: hypothetical protein IT405_02835 [Candidatus Yanofskybacteria bacterium]|nr:hypothetical protein [Candidatus Yanofskybacteria bacterium]
MKKLLVVAAFLVSCVAATPVEAESDFVHHVDLFQVAMVDGKTVVAPDIGYHFTAVHFGRVDVLGVGLAMDLYTGPNGGGKLDPLLVAPIVSVRLTKGTTIFSLGANYFYNPERKTSGVAVGFMIGGN